jgi:hypothetical protein
MFTMTRDRACITNSGRFVWSIWVGRLWIARKTREEDLSKRAEWTSTRIELLVS